jgi:hypothetical protein
VKQYTIKPLEWECIEGVWRASPFGIGNRAYVVGKCTGSPRWYVEGRGLRGHHESVEAAKAACEAHWHERLARCLSEAPPQPR